MTREVTIQRRKFMKKLCIIKRLWSIQNMFKEALHQLTLQVKIHLCIHQGNIHLKVTLHNIIQEALHLLILQVKIHQCIHQGNTHLQVTLHKVDHSILCSLKDTQDILHHKHILLSTE